MNGVSAEYLRPDGTVGYDPVCVLDFDAPDNNDWQVVNQFTVTESGHTRRPDIVVFVNGLPLAIIELKNAASENADVWDAFQQLQTYKSELPALFVFNELLVASDGLKARLGTLSSNRERFSPWRTIEGETLAPATFSELEVLIRGVFDASRGTSLPSTRRSRSTTAPSRCSATLRCGRSPASSSRPFARTSPSTGP